MSTQTVTLNMPETLYDQIQHRAAEAQRSFEEETLDVLATALPSREELPADLQDAIDSLRLLADVELWRAAQNRMPEETTAELESLHEKRCRIGLTDDESRQLGVLLQQYERQMLVRAQAAALLRQRGHDVTRLLQP